MTANRDRDLALGAWFDDIATAPAPSDLLDRVVSATSPRRPRPGWLATMRVRQETAVSAPARLAVILVVLAALAGAALLAGSRLVTTEPLRYQGILEPAGQLATLRDQPAAIALVDGRVLVLGGAAAGVPGEIFDPATGHSTALAGSEFQGPVRAVRLHDGRVVVFGWTSNEPTSLGRPDVRVFDPSTNAWAQVGPMTSPRFEPSIALLKDGRVLVAGGYANQEAGWVESAEILDPATMTFAPAPWKVPWREWQAMVALDDGRVLLAGGCGAARASDQVCDRTTYLSILDPSSGVVQALPAMLLPRRQVAAVPFADGKVLVFSIGRYLDVKVMGHNGVDPVMTDLVDPRAGTVTPGPSLPHTVSTITPLPDGQLLLTGSWQFTRSTVSDFTGPLPQTAEDRWIGILDPRSGITRTSPDPIRAGQGDLTDTDRVYSATAVLGDGRVVLIGDPDQVDNPPANLVEILR